MKSEDVRWPDSLWAAVTPKGPDLSELWGAEAADVVVIGAGFTGLSTALDLRKAGVDVAAIEAMEPGWGASGLNNGQVIPTLSRCDPDDIVARHGAADIHRLGPDAYGWIGCNGRAVALSIGLGAELAKAVRGTPDSELALPFTPSVPIPAHGLLRKIEPLKLLLHRHRDAREIA